MRFVLSDLQNKAQLVYTRSSGQEISGSFCRWRGGKMVTILPLPSHIHKMRIQSVSVWEELCQIWPPECAWPGQI